MRAGLVTDYVGMESADAAAFERRRSTDHGPGRGPGSTVGSSPWEVPPLLLGNGEYPHYGSSVAPISQRSHSRAAPRPSAMAHTTSDCPRRASPAANTPGTLVPYLSKSAFTFERASTSTLRSLSSACSGPRKPIASSTSCAGCSFSLPGCSTGTKPPLSFFSQRMPTVTTLLSLPPSPTNFFTV